VCVGVTVCVMLTECAGALLLVCFSVCMFWCVLVCECRRGCVFLYLGFLWMFVFCACVL